MAATMTRVVARGDAYIPPESERKLSLAFIAVGFAHLLVGVLLGLLQGLEHAGIDLYAYVPLIRHYYQGLSIHGVFNVLVFTTCFIGGFLMFVVGRGLERPLETAGLAWATFWLMAVGIVMVDYTLFTNQASVLFTSYAPLQAHPLYYLGLALVVVGTWLMLVITLRTTLAWRRENPGKKLPLIAFAANATLIMWTLASVGIAIEFVGFLIPWSLGWLPGVDPLLTRTLFWLTGHPIVYFWLLPAYISWYFMLPKQAGGKLFSESLARLAFLLFIPLSLPVGFHHQYLDPGVSEGYKAIHAFLTFAVFMPSAMTAFTVLASLEIGGRARGGKGLLGWVTRLPWNDPAVAAQLLAMVLFALGGVSGLINASYNMNLVVHNTLFVPGHFHLTVGSAVALTFMGVSYWLVPYLSGKKLFSPGLAKWQPWLWFVGMLIMSRGMSWMGILGAPRRTALGSAPYFMADWTMPAWMTAIGGLCLTISGIFFFITLFGTLLSKEKATEPQQVPLAEPVEDNGDKLPGWLDRFTPWVTATVIIVLITYGPSIVRMVGEYTVFPGLRPY